jgi:uncharacterized membrane protein YdjX (TVP38/TMEM64 family)
VGKSWSWWARLLLAAAIVAAALWLYLQREQLQVETLRQTFAGFGGWAPALYIGAYIVGGVLFVATLLTLLGGALFGIWLGAALALSGALAPAVLVLLPRLVKRLRASWSGA